MLPVLKIAGGNFLKGSLIGVANTIPGVSGGTIAVVTGIYDRTIGAISGFFAEHGGWKANTAFLLPILAGAGVGIVAFARIIDFLNVNYPLQTAFLFLGLIAGSLPFLVRTALKANHKPWYFIPFAICLIGVAIMAVASEPDLGNPETALTPALAVLLLISGFISAAAMIVPGVSGSFVMLLLGTYSTVIRAVRDFNIPMIALVGVGALLGLVLVAKLINYLLERHHGPTYYGVIGLVLGSLVGVWPGFTFDLAGLTSVVAGCIGVALALLLGTRKESPGGDPPQAGPLERGGL